MVTAIERRASIFMADIRINAKLDARWRESSGRSLQQYAWSCRKTANDHAKERATSELLIISCITYLFCEGSTESLLEKKKKKKRRKKKGERAGRRQSVSQQVQSKSEWNARVLQFYFIIISHVLDWYRYIYTIYINIYTICFEVKLINFPNVFGRLF